MLWETGGGTCQPLAAVGAGKGVEHQEVHGERRPQGATGGSQEKV